MRACTPLAGLYNSHRSGGLAEWSKAAVLKTVEPRGSRGSNPWPTAKHKRHPIGVPFFVCGYGPVDENPAGVRLIVPKAQSTTSKQSLRSPKGHNRQMRL